MNKRNEKDEFNNGLKKTKLEENSFIEDVLENNDDNLFQPSDYYGEMNEKNEFNLNFSNLIPIKENVDVKPQDIKISTSMNIPENINNMGFYNNNMNMNMMNQMMSMQNNNMNMNMNMNMNNNMNMTNNNNNMNSNMNMNQYNNQNFLNYMNNVNPQQYMNFFSQQMNFMNQNNNNNMQPNNNNNNNNYPFHNFNQMGYGNNNNNNINTSLSLSINNNSNDSIANPVLEEIQNNEKQINQLFQAIDEKSSRLKEIRNNQEFFCKNLNRFTQENYFKIKEEQINLQKEFELVKDQLKNVLKQYLLKTSTLCTIDEYKVTVDINIQQLLVYQSELDFVAKKIPEPKMIMMVQKQPYPCVVKQKEKMTTKTKNEDRLTICIVRGVTDNSIITEGSANLIFDSAKSIANNNIIEGSSTFIDGIAKFNNLRFSKGTGVKMARLNFKTQRKIQPNSKPVELESIPTENFIVITNEAQFGDSAMKLLKKYTFLKDEKTTWNFFANNLQMHYLSATRQKLSSVSRPLSMLDLSYIARTYFNENQFVMVDNFKEFWKWFGKILHKIRHQKPTLEMWNNGYIFGFITKKQAEEILGGLESGTFLIRFSERSPGQFAIDYVSKNKEIKHYLVPPTVKKLADHLREKESLKTIVVSKTDFEIFNVKDCYKGKTGKDGTLGKFYSNSSNESSNFPGYVESLEN